MALKSWHKVGKDQWNRYSVNLAIEPDNKYFIIMVEDFKVHEHLYSKRAKTKSQALKFAKQYMSSH